MKNIIDCGCDFCKVRKLGLIHPIQVAFPEASAEALLVKMYFDKYQNSPKFVPNLFAMWEYESFVRDYKKNKISVEEIARLFEQELPNIIMNKIDPVGYRAKLRYESERKQRLIDQVPNWVI